MKNLLIATEITVILTSLIIPKIFVETSGKILQPLVPSGYSSINIAYALIIFFICFLSSIFRKKDRKPEENSNKFRKIAIEFLIIGSSIYAIFEAAKSNSASTLEITEPFFPYALSALISAGVAYATSNLLFRLKKD